MNKQATMDKSVSFLKGNGGLPFISVNNACASALISLYGAQVLSFKPVGEEDLLFLSQRACYNGRKAIRGGIPVCWPWFGADPEGLNRANHGFARNSLWQLMDMDSSRKDETVLLLKLEPTDSVKRMWPHSCELSLAITVGDTLNLELITRNIDHESVSITQALHAYFNVGDVGKVTISGLENHLYVDKLDNGLQKQQTTTLTISEEVDRIYSGVKDSLTIDDPVMKRRIRISTIGSHKAVVWNPWEKSCAAMSDLDKDDFRRFVCVEAATTEPNSVTTLPGSEHHLIANYKILRC